MDESVGSFWDIFWIYLKMFYMGKQIDRRNLESHILFSRLLPELIFLHFNVFQSM